MLQLVSFHGATLSAVPYTMSAYAYRACDTGIAIEGKLVSASLTTLSAVVTASSVPQLVATVYSTRDSGTLLFDNYTPLECGEGVVTRELLPEISGASEYPTVAKGEGLYVQFTSLTASQSVMNPQLNVVVAVDDEFVKKQYARGD